jgi:orotate phosphoribosyltransferase
VRSEREQAYLDRLFRIGAIKLDGPYKLRNGADSPIFLNFRSNRIAKMGQPGPMSRDDISEAGRVLADRVSSLAIDFDWICGIPRAGEPFAEATAAALHASKKLIRLEAVTEDDHTRMTGRVIGNCQAGDVVLLIDDMVTDAGAKIEAANILAALGLTVIILVMADREQGGAELARRAGFIFIAAFRLSQMLRYYVKRGSIDEAKEREVMDYIRANQFA